ncbi:MAG: cupredoxin domain-containing protein [Chloroflexi bacterium]|nr:cupredoxin domain-containing protein [Chloroflexota bacterium]
MPRSHSTPRRGRANQHHPPARASARAPVRAGLRARALVFFALAVASLGAVGLLLWPRGGEAGPVDQSLEVSMNGFSAPVVTAQSGQALRVRLVNPDSQFHTDGNGWHQFAIPALGIDARVAPRSETVVELPAAEPGDYPFYCDICCGGKENPTMQGTLRVQA